MSFYRQQLEDYLSKLSIDTDRIYDIGGGQGRADERLKSCKCKDYHVLDLPDFDIEDYGISAEYFKKADIIFCLEVFEYLINPLGALTNISIMLKDTGRAYVTFAFAYPHHNELDIDSLRYTETGIRRLAKRAELNIANITYRIDKSGLLRGFYKADGMHPAKEYGHHDVTGFIVEFIK